MRLFSAIMPVVALGFLSGCVAATLGGSTAVGVASIQERTVGGAVDDVTLSAEISGLMFNEDVNHLFSDIDVEVYEGRVLLTGAVDHPDYRMRAVRLAWQPKGVVEVINEIQIKGQPLSIKRAAKDTWITTQIRGRLVATKGIKSINYNVETVNGVVYLIGIAEDRAELDRVTDIVRRIDDVQKVVNHVRLKDSPLRKVRAAG